LGIPRPGFTPRITHCRGRGVECSLGEERWGRMGKNGGVYRGGTKVIRRPYTERRKPVLTVFYLSFLRRETIFAEGGGREKRETRGPPRLTSKKGAR